MASPLLSLSLSVSLSRGIYQWQRRAQPRSRAHGNVAIPRGHEQAERRERIENVARTHARMKLYAESLGPEPESPRCGTYPLLQRSIIYCRFSNNIAMAVVEARETLNFFIRHSKNLTFDFRWSFLSNLQKKNGLS